MTVTITIDIDDPDPVIPKKAVVFLSYGTEGRRIEYTYTGRSRPISRFVEQDTYQRRTFNDMSFSDCEVNVVRNLPESHPIGAPGYVPDVNSFAHHIVHHLADLVPTCVAVDMNSRDR